MSIRPAEPADYPAAVRVIAGAFGVRARMPTVHTVVADSPHGRLLVAERDGLVVGTSAAVAFGRTGWLGGIAVDERARGNGLGRALTEAALEALGPRETILLLATSAGRPIYERLGFEGELYYRTFVSPPDGKTVGIALRAPDPDAVRAFDARVTGETRTLAVDAGIAGAVATADLRAVALRPPWPALPMLARDPEAGAALLGAVTRPGIRVAVPESNEAAVAALLALGAGEHEPVLRMRRGPAVEWRPEELWGVYSLFFG